MGLFLWILVGAPALAQECHYYTGRLRGFQHVSGSRTQVAYRIGAMARRRNLASIVVVDPEGGEVRVWPRRHADEGAPRLHKAVSMESLQATALALMLGKAGQEFDLRVQVHGTVFMPTTTVWSTQVLRIEEGPAGIPYLDTSRSVEAIRQTYALGPTTTEGEAEWTPRRLAMLDQALATLSPTELLAVQGLPIVRSDRKFQLADEQLAGALYSADEDGAEISLLDEGLLGDAQRFVGSPKAPVPRAVRMLVHEVGHALADAPRRWGAAPAESVIDRYARLPGVSAGPTEYAMTSMKESFAEAFSLFHTDPAALGRCMPEVLQWFQEAEHVRELQQAVAEGDAPGIR